MSHDTSTRRDPSHWELPRRRGRKKRTQSGTIEGREVEEESQETIPTRSTLVSLGVPRASAATSGADTSNTSIECRAERNASLQFEDTRRYPEMIDLTITPQPDDALDNGRKRTIGLQGVGSRKKIAKASRGESGLTKEGQKEVNGGLFTIFKV